MKEVSKFFYKRRNVSGGKMLLKRLLKYRALLLMLMPGICFILLFNYGPMYGVQIAFKEYRILDGIWESPWVGFKYFRTFFGDTYSLNVLKNTIFISIYRLVLGFPAPIILALLLNEIGKQFFKRFAQTVSYLPHFISWVIISGVVIGILSPNTGIVNYFIKSLGGKSIYFMADTGWFPTVLVLSGIWKEVGWGTVVYLAAISSIGTQMYESAIIDGATRIQRMRYITVPSLLPLISIVLILNMGGILNAGFDQIFNMYNPLLYEVADIIDTYVYRLGLVNMHYEFSTAVGLFKSVVGLTLMLIVHSATKRLGSNDYGLW